MTAQTPPGGTVLDPFAGSGSTGRAARVTLAADILAACTEPRTPAELTRATGAAASALDPVLASLVLGCYLIVDRVGRYRRSTRDERDAWMTQAEPRPPP